MNPIVRLAYAAFAAVYATILVFILVGHREIPSSVLHYVTSF